LTFEPGSLIFNYMVDYRTESLDRTFHALSDATRRAMLLRMSRGECSVSELAEPFDLTLAAVSKHLKVLEEANFVRKSKEGRVVRCRAELAPLKEVSALLEQLGRQWNRRLDALEEFLKMDQESEGVPHARSGTKNDSERRRQTNGKGKKS
jgi:DNA-binding transcriptional ArsR family regulator